MAVESVRYAPTLGTGDTNRGPSNAIWSSCPVATIMEEPRLGMYFFDDFLVSGNANMTSAYQNSIGQWTAYGDAGAVLGDAAKEGGIIKISPNASNENVTLQSSSGSFRILTTSTLALNGKLWFEARIAKSLITTAHITCAVGLMTPQLSSSLPPAAQPLSATDDALATTMDFFGFILSGTTSTRGGPTEVGTGFVLTSGTANYPTNQTALMAATSQTVLAADTYVKVGFLFDPAAPTALVTSARFAGQRSRHKIQFRRRHVIDGRPNLPIGD